MKLRHNKNSPVKLEPIIKPLKHLEKMEEKEKKRKKTEEKKKLAMLTSKSSNSPPGSQTPPVGGEIAPNIAGKYFFSF
jgi:hypothetical protein